MSTLTSDTQTRFPNKARLPLRRLGYVCSHISEYLHQLPIFQSLLQQFINDSLMAHSPNFVGDSWQVAHFGLGASTDTHMLLTGCSAGGLGSSKLCKTHLFAFKNGPGRDVLSR